MNHVSSYDIEKTDEKQKGIGAPTLIMFSLAIGFMSLTQFLTRSFKKFFKKS